MRFNPIGNEFAAVVEGIDLCAPLNSAQVATIHAGMDRHAVLVFHDQPLTDEQQIAFTRSLGKIELNTANNITRLDQRRLSVEMSDISSRRPAVSRYSCRPTSAASSAGRCRKQWPLCAILSSTRPSDSSFTPTPGGNMIS
jgi:alpha-ketoglutarate-dependent taurine dioxygenase